MQANEFEALTSWFKTNVWELSDNDGVDIHTPEAETVEREESRGSATLQTKKKPKSKTPPAYKAVSAAYDYDPMSDTVKREKLADEQTLFEHIIGLDIS